MSEELKALVEKWKNDLTRRDSGYTAGQTYKKIKDLASPEELIQILEEQFVL